MSTTANAIKMEPAQVPGQQTEFEFAFPLIYQCKTPGATVADGVEWARAHRAELVKKVGEHGAILFRGLPLNSPEDCDAFVAAFGLKNFPYNESLSNAVRVNYTERIFSANEAPPDVTIYFHHEMAQTPIYPKSCSSFAYTPAEEGGETPLCRSDILFERLADAARSSPKTAKRKACATRT